MTHINWEKVAAENRLRAIKQAIASMSPEGLDSVPALHAMKGFAAYVRHYHPGTNIDFPRACELLRDCLKSSLSEALNDVNEAREAKKPPSARRVFVRRMWNIGRTAAKRYFEESK